MSAPAINASQRAETRSRALAMRRDGRKLREISAALGVPASTVWQWVNDPDGAKLRARKRGYGGVCESCGGRTNGADGAAKAPRVCMSCLQWSPEQIVQAMRDWADAHGGLPPTSTEWNPTDGSHPSASSVRRGMGWNEALLAAGFDPRCDRRLETQREMEQMLREDRSVREVAEHFGWTTDNVYKRLRRRGLTVARLRREQQA